MVEYLIESSGATYIQVDLVWRIILALILGQALIHGFALAAVVLCKFSISKFYTDKEV